MVVRLATGAKDLTAEVKELAVAHLPAGAGMTIDGKLDEAAWGRRRRGRSGFGGEERERERGQKQE